MQSATPPSAPSSRGKKSGGKAAKQPMVPTGYSPQDAAKAADDAAWNAEQARLKQDGGPNGAPILEQPGSATQASVTLYQSPMANNIKDPAQPGTWPVYFSLPQSATVADHQIDSGQQGYASASQAHSALFGMSQPQIAALQDKMVAAGYLDKGFIKGIADAQTVKAYDDLLTEASQRINAGKFVTLDDVLAQRAAAVAAQGGPAGSGKKNSTSVNLTNPVEANDAIDKAFQSRLGRRATPQEKAAFLSSLHSAEQSNPHTTDYTLDPTTGNTQTETVAQGIGGFGGVDAASFADQYAQSGAAGVEANTHAAATTYYDAALQLIGAAR